MCVHFRRTSWRRKATHSPVSPVPQQVETSSHQGNHSKPCGFHNIQWHIILRLRWGRQFLRPRLGVRYTSRRGWLRYCTVEISRRQKQHYTYQERENRVSGVWSRVRGKRCGDYWSLYSSPCTRTPRYWDAFLIILLFVGFCFYCVLAALEFYISRKLKSSVLAALCVDDALTAALHLGLSAGALIYERQPFMWYLDHYTAIAVSSIILLCGIKILVDVLVFKDLPFKIRLNNVHTRKRCIVLDGNALQSGNICKRNAIVFVWTGRRNWLKMHWSTCDHGPNLLAVKLKMSTENMSFLSRL